MKVSVKASVVLYSARAICSRGEHCAGDIHANTSQDKKENRRLTSFRRKALSEQLIESQRIFCLLDVSGHCLYGILVVAKVLTLKCLEKKY